ncbi:hypothetical protein Megpolyxen_01412 [Candidatus Megaera polyxenophila]|nr:hypothetical protein Megpolyxen_01412 [Candidatus Megaera polyxenophila]
MFISNRFSVSTPAPVLATNDANVNTGITGSTWGGCNPTTQGATGNAAAGNGLTNIATVQTYQRQVVGKLVQVSFTGALTAGVDNYVRVPLAQLGINTNKAILGAAIVGVYDTNAVEGNNTPTPSWINVGGGLALISIIKDALVIKIPNGNQALFQNKMASILLIY